MAVVLATRQVKGISQAGELVGGVRALSVYIAGVVPEEILV